MLKFSKNYCDKINARGQEGYELTEAKVNHLFYWKSDEEDKGIKIVLPELYSELQSKIQR